MCNTTTNNTNSKESVLAALEAFIARATSKDATPAEMTVLADVVNAWLGIVKEDYLEY